MPDMRTNRRILSANAKQPLLFGNKRTLRAAAFFLVFCISCVGTHGMPRNRKSPVLFELEFLAFGGKWFSAAFVVENVVTAKSRFSAKSVVQIKK